MKKILFLIQLPPPIHGASVVNKLISESQRVNAEFCCRYLNISPALDMDDLGKIKARKIFLTLRIFVMAIAKYIKFKPDIVYLTLSPHGFAFYKDAVLAILIKIMRGKLVFHLHGKGIKNVVEGSFLRSYIYKIVFKNVAIIHLSESLFEDVAAVKDPNSPICFLNNGVDPIYTSETTRDQGDENAKLTFVYLSNLVPSKGADILVKATKLLTPELRDKCIVKLIGKQSDQEFLHHIKTLITKDCAHSIRILGPLYGEIKNKELVNGDVFVLPTRFKNECFPLSILEAMSAKMAVISTNEGAIPDIVEHGRSGYIIENLTPEALAEYMTILIQNRSLVNEFSETGYQKYVNSFTTDKFETNFISIMNTLSA